MKMINFFNLSIFWGGRVHRVPSLTYHGNVFNVITGLLLIKVNPISSNKKSAVPKKSTNDRKPHAARLINQDSLLELDFAVPSIKKESLPPNVEGGAPFYYGDTLCLAGGYNTNTSTLLKKVECWNPLQGNSSFI